MKLYRKFLYYATPVFACFMGILIFANTSLANVSTVSAHADFTNGSAGGFTIQYYSQSFYPEEVIKYNLEDNNTSRYGVLNYSIDPVMIFDSNALTVSSGRSGYLNGYLSFDMIFSYSGGIFDHTNIVLANVPNDDSFSVGYRFNDNGSICAFTFYVYFNNYYVTNASSNPVINLGSINLNSYISYLNGQSNEITVSCSISGLRSALPWYTYPVHSSMYDIYYYSLNESLQNARLDEVYQKLDNMHTLIGSDLGTIMYYWRTYQNDEMNRFLDMYAVANNIYELLSSVYADETQPQSMLDEQSQAMDSMADNLAISTADPSLIVGNADGFFNSPDLNKVNSKDPFFWLQDETGYLVYIVLAALAVGGVGYVLFGRGS